VVELLEAAVCVSGLEDESPALFLSLSESMVVLIGEFAPNAELEPEIKLSRLAATAAPVVRAEMPDCTILLVIRAATPI
jgi:hypothetical protein